MDAYQEQPPKSGISPVVWIVGGVAVLCVCALILLVVGGAGYIFYAQSLQSDDFLFPTQAAIPGVYTRTPPAELTLEAATIQPPAGLDVEEIPTDEPLHESEGTEIEYSTNPPTSGHHYPDWADPGLYDEVVPDGYLVHNLEHGYVIIWYDCDTLTDAECETLMDDIQSVIDFYDGYKVIGMPRSGMATTLALTSWGRLARLDAFNFDLIVEFIALYQEQAPEPNAP